MVSSVCYPVAENKNTNCSGAATRTSFTFASEAPSSLTDGRKALANNICEVNRESLSLGGVWGILLLTWPWFSTSSWEVLLFCRDSRKLNLRKGGLLDVFPTLSFSLDV